MSQSTVARTSALLAAATALTAAAFLAVPVTAQADPTIPLPPLPCDNYGFNGDVLLSQSNGYTVNFTSTGAAASGKAYANGASVMEGDVSGSISGRHVDFTIRWGGGPRGHYTGDVGDDNLAHGVTVDEANPSSSAHWDSTAPLVCMTPAQSAQQAPAQTGPTQSLPTHTFPVHVATVTNDVDVYNVKNVPDGAGTVIGMLSSGRQVKYLRSCSPNDWCNVLVPELPGGMGWIWGNLQL